MIPFLFYLLASSVAPNLNQPQNIQTTLVFVYEMYTMYNKYYPVLHFSIVSGKHILSLFTLSLKQIKHLKYLTHLHQLTQLTHPKPIEDDGWVLL